MYSTYILYTVVHTTYSYSLSSFGMIFNQTRAAGHHRQVSPCNRIHPKTQANRPTRKRRYPSSYSYSYMTTYNILLVLNIYTYIHTYILYIHTHTHTHTHTQPPPHTHTHKYIYIHTYIHTTHIHRIILKHHLYHHP